ncbi:MAG TPA: PTS sugar transporter subunit IIA [Thermoflexus sp.]|nr:PTS sugar transporter subunit IIA [Thermoflexus sp.]
MSFLEALNGRIRILKRTSSWQEAVQISGELLAADGLVAPSYVERMIRTCEELGPYIAIAPGVAIPHARPEDGAHAFGLSLVIVQEGVRFGSHNDPVYLLIAFATPDRSAHIDFLRQLAELLAHADELVQALRRCESADQAHGHLKTLLERTAAGRFSE